MKQAGAVKMQFVLNIRTVNELNGSREHWGAVSSRRKRHRQMAWLLCPNHPIPCNVTMTRYSAGKMDDDGLRAALKSVRDGIAQKLGVNDGGDDVVWLYGQVKAKRGVHHIVVDINEPT